MYFCRKIRVVRCYVYHEARPRLLLSSFSVAVIFFTPHGLAKWTTETVITVVTASTKIILEYSTATAVIESYKDLKKNSPFLSPFLNSKN